MDRIWVNLDELLEVLEDVKASGATNVEIAINEPDPLDPGSPACLSFAAQDPVSPEALIEFDFVDAISDPFESAD